MNAMEMVKQGGAGSAISYLLLTVPTDWLGYLPAIPEGHYLPMVAALGAVITAALRLAGLGKQPAQPPEQPPST